MKYGKIINNELFIAQNPLKLEDKIVYNPTDKIYEENGYKPITETTRPVEDGFYFVPIYEERENYIIQKWEKYEEEKPTKPTEQDRIEAQVMYTALITDTLLEV